MSFIAHHPASPVGSSNFAANDSARTDTRAHLFVNFAVHCWDYRRFLVAKNSVSDEEELKFSRKRIDSNFSNYSSWHYRSKLLPKLTPRKDGVSIEKKQLEEEFKLVLNAAFTDPQDQSAWMYHRWLLGKGEFME